MRILSTLVLSFFSTFLFSQTNILTTNPLAKEIMLGNYNPADYAAGIVIDQPEDIKNIINNELNTDSLTSYLFKLSTFENRNTCSDTVSNTFGIGAARRWTNSMFEKFSGQNEGRLIPFYLQFDQNLNAQCSMNRFRNSCAILPGSDPESSGIIIIEAHMDSRCENVWDGN